MEVSPKFPVYLNLHSIQFSQLKHPTKITDDSDGSVVAGDDSWYSVVSDNVARLRVNDDIPSWDCGASIAPVTRALGRNLQAEDQSFNQKFLSVL